MVGRRPLDMVALGVCHDVQSSLSASGLPSLTQPPVNIQKLPFQETSHSRECVSTNKQPYIDYWVHIHRSERPPLPHLFARSHVRVYIEAPLCVDRNTRPRFVEDFGVLKGCLRVKCAPQRQRNEQQSLPISTKTISSPSPASDMTRALIRCQQRLLFLDRALT